MLVLICTFLRLLKQTWVHEHTLSEANLLTPGCVEGKSSAYCRCQARSPDSRCSKHSNSPMTFKEKFFRDRAREGVMKCVISSWIFFWMVGGEVTGNQHHRPSGSSWSGVYVLVGNIQLSSFTCWGFQYLQNSSDDMAQNIIHSPWGDSKCRWFCLMAKLLYYLSCLTVVLCFCIFSLLQLNLFCGTQGRPRRLKIFYRQESSGWETLGGSWGILLGYTKDKMKTVCLFTLLKGNPIPLTLFLPVKFDLTSLLLAFVLQMKFHGLAQKYLLMFINIEQCKTEMSVPSPHSSYERPCCVIEVVQSTSSVTLNIRWNLIFTERQCWFRGCWTLVWMLVATTK